MSDAERVGKFTISTYLGWPLFLGLVLILIGVALGIVAAHDDIWQKIAVAGITEVGFAFFIAHIIIIVVDRKEKQSFSDFVKDEHRKTKEDLEIAQRRLATRAVLSQLLATDVPTSISNELEDYILSSKILKRSQKLTFELKPVGKYTALHFEAEAVFENTRRESHPWYPPYVNFGEEFVRDYFEQKLPHEKFGLETHLIFIKKSNSSDFALVFDASSHQSTLSRQEESYLLGPGDQVRLMISDRKARFGIDNEIFTNFSFCEKMEVFLKYVEADYDVGYRAIHPKSKVMHTEPYFEGKKIVLDVPFMPGNGILIWWKRKDPTLLLTQR